MSDYENLRRRLRGPVYPVIPAFMSSGALDLQGTRDYVDLLIRRGAGVLMVTAGTSRLNLLSFEEVSALNRVVAEACDSRAVAVAGNPASGSTEMTSRLMREAEASGADAFLAIYPERYYGNRPVVEFFAELSRASPLGLLVHAIPMRLASTGPTQVQLFSMPLVEEIVKLPTIVGMKEENGVEALRQQIVQSFDGEVPIVLAGGAMRSFLASWPFGASSYLVGIGSFLPELEQQFYADLQRGDVEAARRIVRDLELPYFEIAVAIGWHTALKATLALLDLMPPFERAPLCPPNGKEIAALSGLLQRLDWLPRAALSAS